MDILSTVLTGAAGFVGYILAEFGVPIPETAPIFKLFAAAAVIVGLPLGKFVSTNALGLWRVLWLPIIGVFSFFSTMCAYLVLNEKGAAEVWLVIIQGALLMISFGSLSFLLATAGSAMVEKKRKVAPR